MEHILRPQRKENDKKNGKTYLLEIHIFMTCSSHASNRESGLTPLHVASFMGCMNIAIFLLQNGAKPDATT